MTDTPSMADEPESNIKLFRGKATVREMQRTNHEDLLRRLDTIEKRLDAIERSL